MLATCIHMMQGTPYIYQGEELGMTNAGFEQLTDYRDIETLNIYQELTEAKLISSEEMMQCIKARSRDNARTPVQWDDGANAGFTTGNPWIAVIDNYKEINAADQVARADSVYHYYQKLIQLRKENEIIVYGIYELLNPEDTNTFMYTRTYEKEKLLVLLNFTEKEQLVSIPEEFSTGKASCMISNYENPLQKENILRAYEAVVLKL